VDVYNPTPAAVGGDEDPASATASGDGSILVVWNPDNSWDRDPMIRVNTVMGEPLVLHACTDQHP